MPIPFGHPEPLALLDRTFLGHHPVEMPYSFPGERVGTLNGSRKGGTVDLGTLGPRKDWLDLLR
jgi:hypothetical protein